MNQHQRTTTTNPDLDLQLEGISAKKTSDPFRIFWQNSNIGMVPLMVRSKSGGNAPVEENVVYPNSMQNISSMSKKQDFLRGISEHV